MSSTSFKIISHTIPCQHIREYPHATAKSQEDVLYLAVKQYIPSDNPNPKSGDITIIAAAACGFPKELYEPLWEELLSRSAKTRSFKIRSIWMADLAQQGESGVLNEAVLGNDPSWNDHARDLLHLINLKREEMPLPLVGVGHSMGGNQLVNVAYIHPRLFSTLILIDPAFGVLSSTPPEAGPGPGTLSMFRKDVWPSRDAAAASFRGSNFYRQWDPRVLDRWIKYGLRDVPTPVYPEHTEQVTLATTKHQEVFTFLRPNFDGYGADKSPDRNTHPDLNPDVPPASIFPFYRAESPQAFFRLGELRPSVLYIFGGKSAMSLPSARQEKMENTGIGVGGSGGAKAGRVKSVLIEDAGHLMPMDADILGPTADAASDWLNSEMGRWRKEQAEFETWSAKPIREKQMMDGKWKEMIGPLPGKKQGPPKL